jgi:hypothetical protein
MAKHPTPTDLDEYLPDAAARAELAAGSPDYNRNVDPKLVEKLRGMGTNPDLLRVAPPSVKEHVGPTEVPGAGHDRKSAPRGQARVELATERPTTPALKRLQGEPDVPGVVKGPSTVAPPDPQTAGQRVSPRAAVLAVLAVLIPVLIVIVVMGRVAREERNGTVPSVASGDPAVTTSALPAPAVSTAPTASSSSAPAPSITPTAVAPASTSAAAPAPTVPKHQPRGALEEPRGPAPGATSVASATPPAVPTAPPIPVPAPSTPAAPPPAPTAPPSEPTRPPPAPVTAPSGSNPWFP